MFIKMKRLIKLRFYFKPILLIFGYYEDFKVVKHKSFKGLSMKW